MKNADVLKILNKVGEDFGWQIGSVPTNYVNGYMQAIRDCKSSFYGKEREEAKKVVTNADRIRNMSDEELAEFLNVTVYESGENLFCCEDYDKKVCSEGGSCKQCKVYRVWLKEKVE